MKQFSVLLIFYKQYNVVCKIFCIHTEYFKEAVCEFVREEIKQFHGSNTLVMRPHWTHPLYRLRWWAQGLFRGCTSPA